MTIQSSTLEDRELDELLTQFPLVHKKKEPQPNSKQKVIVISGPTGVGKTDLSLLIAHAIGGEIISADSMQVYLGMDVGTAKVSVENRRKIPHHLIDIKELSESFNVAEFYAEATRLIQEILQKDHVPIVVGGTGFYIHALLYGPPLGPPSDLRLRKELEEEANLLGVSSLYQRLCELDPDYAATITAQDRHKIVRALEIITLSHKKVSDFKVNSFKSPYHFRCWFLYSPKEVLYPRIERRCDEMLEHGFIEEVKRLESTGLKQNHTASQAVGYRQALEFLQSPQTEEDWERFVFAFKQASKKYAKRQLTWFRKEPLFRWLNLYATSLDIAAEVILQDYEFS